MPQTSGINLKIGGLSSFLSGMTAVAKAYNKAGAASAANAEKITKYGRMVDAASRRVVRAQNNEIKAWNKHREATNKIIDAQRTLDTVMRSRKATTATVAKAQEELSKAVENGEQISRDYTNSLTRTEDALAGLTAWQEKLMDALKGTEGAAEGMAKGFIESATGIQLTTAASAGLVAGLVAVVAAFLAVKVAINIAKKAFELFKSVVRGVIDIIRKVVSAIKALITGALGLLAKITAPLRDMFSRIFSVAGGVALYDVIRKITYAIKGMVTETMGAVATFQKLYIQFATIAARDYAREFGVGVAEAYEKSAGAAKELLDWVKKLAVQVPVEAEYIARMLALSNAMGLTTQKSKEVVKATMNFGAALGLASDRMWNIIYNFGQMIQRGKLTGEEFRDLSRNFVPINDILATMAERVDMTTEDFRELAMEGGVPVMEFLDEFIRVANEDFPGALEKMGRTLDGVTTRFKSFIKVFVGLETLGPMADSLAGKLADMLDVLAGSQTALWTFKLLGEALRLSFEGLWEAVSQFTSAISSAFSVLMQWNAGIDTADRVMTGIQGHLAATGYMFDSVKMSMYRAAVAIVGISILISRAIGNMANRIREWASDTNTTFASLARQAFDWGVNFISQFAYGMAQAISILVTVINTIANIINRFFGPGSPPLIAQDIDKWGKAMIEEFYKGFLLGDLNIITKLSGLIESWIRSLDIDEAGIVPMILGARSAIQDAIRAVRDGLMSIDEAARRVAASIGRGGEMFYDYARAMLELARVSELVTEAQEELNAVTEYYDDLLRDLNNQLTKVTQEYDEQKRLAAIAAAMGSGLLTIEEMERLEMEKRAILLRQQIRATEQERDIAIDAANEKLEALRAEEDLMQARVRAIEQYIRLQMEMNNLIQEQADLLKRLADAAKGTDGEEKKEDDEIIPPSLPSMLPTPPDFSSMLADAEEWADNMSATLEEAFKPLTDLTAEGGPFDRLSESLTNLQTAFGGLVGEGGVIVMMADALKNLNEYLFVGVMGGEGEAGAPQRGASRFELFAQGVETAAGILHATWINFLLPFWEGFTMGWPGFKEGWESFGESMKKVAENFNTALEVLGIERIEGSLLGWISKGAGLLVSAPIRLAAVALWALAESFEFLSNIGAGIWTAMDKIVGFLKAVSEFSVFQFGAGDNKKEGGFISGLIGGIKSALDTGLPVIAGLFTALFTTPVKLAFEILSKSLVGASIIPDMLTKIKTAIETGLGDAVTTWNGLVTQFSTDMTTAETDVTSFIKSGLVPLEGFIKGKLTRSLRTLLAGPLARLKYMFNDWLPTGLKETITLMGDLEILVSGTLHDAMEDATDDMRAFGNELFDVRDYVWGITNAIYGLIEAAEAMADTEFGFPGGNGNGDGNGKDKLQQWWDDLQDKVPPDTPKPPGLPDDQWYAQYGGRVPAHQATIVGERRPELFIPDVPGVIVPRVPRFFENMLTRVGGRFNSPMMGSPVVHGNMNVDNSVNLEMNPTYEDVQLPNEIFYDVVSALNASKR